MAAPVDLLRKVPLFEDLSKRELERLPEARKETRLSARGAAGPSWPRVWPNGAFAC